MAGGMSMREVLDRQCRRRCREGARLTVCMHVTSCRQSAHCHETGKTATMAMQDQDQTWTTEQAAPPSLPPSLPASP
jgi:hypothetical protein